MSGFNVGKHHASEDVPFAFLDSPQFKSIFARDQVHSFVSDFALEVLPFGQFVAHILITQFESSMVTPKFDIMHRAEAPQEFSSDTHTRIYLPTKPDKLETALRPLSRSNRLLSRRTALSSNSKAATRDSLNGQVELGCHMIDWEDLAQRQIAETQRALPEPIRGRAIEVPVFLKRVRTGKSGTCLGVFEGYSLLEGSPNQPNEMPRITLFLDNLARAANFRRTVFLREVQITYLHELGHYLGWDEEQIANVGLA